MHFVCLEVPDPSPYILSISVPLHRVGKQPEKRAKNFVRRRETREAGGKTKRKEIASEKERNATRRFRQFVADLSC